MRSPVYREDGGERERKEEESRKEERGGLEEKSERGERDSEEKGERREREGREGEERGGERGRGVKKVWRRPRLGDGPIISNMPRFSSMCFILMPVESSLPAPSLSYSSMSPNLPSSVGNFSCTRPFRHGSERHSVLKAVLTMLRSSS